MKGMRVIHDLGNDIAVLDGDVKVLRYPHEPSTAAERGNGVKNLRVLHDVGNDITVFDGQVEILRYTYMPDTVQLESPKPYLHPLRTRGGQVVSLFRPYDHVWHKGIAWSLPHVGEENFWGGPTYVHGSFYVQLENNGAQQHQEITELSCQPGRALMNHTLRWTTQSGTEMFKEQRKLQAVILDEESWCLTFETTMKNVSGEPISIGSPTTKGRDNAGYGGLFWRGPRSFTNGSLITSNGMSGGDELRGSRAPWMAFEGQHDNSSASSTVLIYDAHDNPQHPPQWFARSEEFACLNPAPFFSEELEIGPTESIRFRYGVAIADGVGKSERLAELVAPIVNDSLRNAP